MKDPVYSPYDGNKGLIKEHPSVAICSQSLPSLPLANAGKPVVTTL
jgi:hypothetical protein